MEDVWFGGASFLQLYVFNLGRVSSSVKCASGQKK